MTTTSNSTAAGPSPAADPKGRSASSPTELPLSAWPEILRRVWTAFSEDRVLLVGAGATFYALLALVPAVAAFVSVYGLVFDRDSVVAQVSAMSGMLAPEVQAIIQEQLTRLTAEATSSLGVAFAISLAASLWSASAGTKAVMDGLNIVYHEEEKRSFIGYNGTALALTLAGLVGAVLVLAITIALPVLLETLLPNVNQTLVTTASYLALLAFLWIGLIVVFRYGPSRDEAEWRWLATGTVVAVILLAVFSVLFSWFARTFAGYASYGSLGSIIAFMTWVWVSMVLVLLGAEINAEMEHQTAQDTTTGREEPMGERGASMADRLPSATARTSSPSDPATGPARSGFMRGAAKDGPPVRKRPRDYAAAIAGLVLLTAALQVVDRYVRRRRQQMREADAERAAREAERAYRGG